MAMFTRYYLINVDPAEFRQLLLDQRELAKADMARHILPADTTFALVAEVVELPAGQPSAPSAAKPARPAKPPRGVVPYPYYISYAAVVGSDFCLIAGDGSVKLNVPAASVRMTRESGVCIVYADNQKVCFEGPLLPITGDMNYAGPVANPHGGFDTLVDILRQQGASIEFAPSSRNATVRTVVLVIVLFVIGFLIFAGRHR